MSLTNIRTKKGRTLLTAFASSIGIIGIAIILALSNGFDKQIDNFESDTLSSFPIMISQQAMEMDITQMQEHSKEMMGTDKNESDYPDVNVVYPYNSQEKTMIHTNQLDESYVEYIEKLDPNLVMGISYTRVLGINLLNKVDDEVKTLKTTSINFSVLPKELSKDESTFLERGYDVLAGRLPENDTELLLQVDKKNRIEKSVLETLGINAESETVDFSDILEREMKLVLNKDYYTQIGNYYTINKDLQELYNNSNNRTLRIVGIVRGKEDNTLASMTSMINTSIQTQTGGTASIGSILYSNELIENVLKENRESSIAKAQQEADYNVLTGEKIDSEEEKNNLLNYLGAKDIPYLISIYPNNFNDKEKILNYLDEHNDGLEKEKQIIYTDMAEQFSSLSGSIMDAITIVLIAFSAISLIVSTIMIAIITYISVLERTKEIGVLRALGARKKDVTRVFNAETFLIGICSGAIGIGITCLLIPGINAVLEQITDLANIAKLNPVHAALLITISVVLTLLGGWIPAKMAAKKDPVNALRSE